MASYLQLRTCINPHDGRAIQYFDPAGSDSELPAFFCCARCEHDWVANRLQALTPLDAVDLVTEVLALLMDERRHN